MLWLFDIKSIHILLSQSQLEWPTTRISAGPALFKTYTNSSSIVFESLDNLTEDVPSFWTDPQIEAIKYSEKYRDNRIWPKKRLIFPEPISRREYRAKRICDNCKSGPSRLLRAQYIINHNFLSKSSLNLTHHRLFHCSTLGTARAPLRLSMLLEAFARPSNTRLILIRHEHL